jgi:hypothetical protein
MTFYVGGENTSMEQLGQDTPRFFYGLRLDKTSGTLYFVRVDQLTDQNASTIINNPGETSGNFEMFEYGVDFFDGILADHSSAYANLRYQQYRWDVKNIYYYIDNTGELVARINQVYNSYPS